MALANFLRSPVRLHKATTPRVGSRLRNSGVANRDSKTVGSKVADKARDKVAAVVRSASRPVTRGRSFSRTSRQVHIASASIVMVSFHRNMVNAVGLDRAFQSLSNLGKRYRR